LLFKFLLFKLGQYQNSIGRKKMSKNNIDSNLVLKAAIEQIPVRIRRANKRQIDLANEVGTSEGHLSQILNFHIKAPRLTMMNKIEKVLKSWGV
jgi:hypothetical protein